MSVEAQHEAFRAVLAEVERRGGARAITFEMISGASITAEHKMHLQARRLEVIMRSYLPRKPGMKEPPRPPREEVRADVEFMFKLLRHQNGVLAQSNAQFELVESQMDAAVQRIQFLEGELHKAAAQLQGVAPVRDGVTLANDAQLRNELTLRRGRR